MGGSLTYYLGLGRAVRVGRAPDAGPRAARSVAALVQDLPVGAVLALVYRYNGIPLTQTLKGPLSAALRLIFATIGLFSSILQALQGRYAFA